MTARPYALIDIDGVLGCGQVAPHCHHVPRADTLVRVCDALGYELHAWSAGGSAHARDVVAHGGWARMFTDYHTKPDYRTTAGRALEAIGRDHAPAIQVDDDPTERVSGWPFLLASEWYAGVEGCPFGNPIILGGRGGAS